MAASALGIAGILFASGSLLASLYIVSLALLGARWRSRHPAQVAGDSATTFLILIPAHNEEEGIQSTIQSALGLDYPSSQFRVVVIADNCDDNTVIVTEKSGATVWIRRDLENRGKGQALAWALDRAASEIFDMLLVVDADTKVDANFLRVIDYEFQSIPQSEKGVVFQGRYEFAAAQENAGWFESFTLASKDAENSFVYFPRSRLGLMNLLQGNGFCVSRSALQCVPFAASSVVEDAEYAVTLALAGLRVRYVEEARVVSRTTRTIGDAAPQRLRWATGIFQLIGRSVPKLLVEALRRRQWRLAEGAIMMLLTSRLVVVYLTVVAFVCALLSLGSVYTRVTVVLLVATCLLQTLYLFLMFRKAGREAMPISSILFMPVYFALICLAQAGALLGFKRKQWSRTVR
jgi:cellulose synthase/poly-beta-1,6-N-acetylglucosamine synthase-like glycosyltransferase